MRYYCDICLRDIKKKIKHSHLKSKSQKEFEKYKHITLSLKNVDIKNVDEIIYLYMKDQIKNFNQFKLKGQFKLVFNNNQDCKYLTTDIINNTTYISWSNYFREAIDNIKEERYVLKQIADIITLAHKCDMTYDYFLKHNMPAFERKLIAMINKDKKVINKFSQTWRHPINMKSNCYRNNIICMEFVKEFFLKDKH